MEERYAQLEITPKIIDFGTRVVQMRNVASAGLEMVYPWRWLAKYLYLLALLLIGTSLTAMQGAISRYGGSDTSILITTVVGVIALVSGIAVSVKGTLLLVLHLAGNQKVVVQEAEPEFLQTLLDRIRETMLASGDTSVRYVVDMTSQSIETQPLLDRSGAPMAHDGGTVRPHINGHAASNGADAHPSHAHGVEANGGAQSAARAHHNGIAYPLPHSAAEAHASSHAAAAHPTAHAATRGGTNTRRSAPAMNSPSGGATVAPVPTQASVSQDLHHMIALIEHARVPDQERVIEYLRLLQQLAEAGPARASEARATWLTFFDYAAKALAGVDGFMPVAERVHRWFMARA